MNAPTGISVRLCGLVFLLALFAGGILFSSPSWFSSDTPVPPHEVKTDRPKTEVDDTSSTLMPPTETNALAPSLLVEGVPTDPDQDEVIHLCVNSSSIGIQIVSDLHIEMYMARRKNQTIPMDLIIPRAPILALLGDIGLACTWAWRDFVQQQAQRFQHVLILAGNHEYYNKAGRKRRSILEQFHCMREACVDEMVAPKKNVHFLERRVVNINNGHVMILAATLWSYVPPDAVSTAERSMNDYHISYVSSSSSSTDLLLPEEQEDGGGTKSVQASLHRMTASVTNKWHEISVAWLEKQLSMLRESSSEGSPTTTTTTTPNVLVLTHHAPDMQGTSNPLYDDSPLTVCFASDLRRLLTYPIHTWASGHTHYNYDQYYPYHNNDEDGEDASGFATRLLSNQRGYPGSEKDSYQNDGVVVVI